LYDHHQLVYLLVSSSQSRVRFQEGLNIFIIKTYFNVFTDTNTISGLYFSNNRIVERKILVWFQIKYSHFAFLARKTCGKCFPRCNRSDAGPILESTYWVGKKLEHMERRHTNTDTKTPKLSCSKINVPKTPNKKALGAFFTPKIVRQKLGSQHSYWQIQYNCKLSICVIFRS
jgi:hypothetical protein